MEAADQGAGHKSEAHITSLEAKTKKKAKTAKPDCHVHISSDFRGDLEGIEHKPEVVLVHHAGIQAHKRLHPVVTAFQTIHHSLNLQQTNNTLCPDEDIYDLLLNQFVFLFPVFFHCISSFPFPCPVLVSCPFILPCFAFLFQAAAGVRCPRIAFVANRGHSSVLLSGMLHQHNTQVSAIIQLMIISCTERNSIVLTVAVHIMLSWVGARLILPDLIATTCPRRPLPRLLMQPA